MQLNTNLIPEYVSRVTNTLEKGGFEAYLVGGCVRDLILERTPKDWDVTTNAKPEQIIALFEKTVYENTFGTVAVCVPRETPDPAGLPYIEDVGYVSPETSNYGGQTSVVTRETSNNYTSTTCVAEETPKETVLREKYDIVEVTPYRIEGKYDDFRHPNEVLFSETLAEDLKRRDFTINAIAMDSIGQIIDLHNGLSDISYKTLKTVGSADARYKEDALRMLRAVRFAVQLNFSISDENTESIFKNANLIKKISQERIRDEFSKIIMSKTPAMGITLLQKLNLLKHIISELEEGIGCDQFGAHIYDVWNHSLYALQHAADKNWPLEIRLAALFHDIGKPRTRRLSQATSLTPPYKAKKTYSFYGHDVVSAKMAQKIMERIKFPKKEIDLVEKLVRNHMFFSDTEKITLSAVRRIIAKIGKENIWLLMNLRECDRVGTNKKAISYRLRQYFGMIEEALHDPISLNQLKIDGTFLIKELNMKPSPRMGFILNSLLEEILEDPEKNTVDYLKNKTLELDKLSDQELKELGDKAKTTKENLEKEEVKKLHGKHL
ncbi:MAG: HD domain-containing protein [Patescibacteria group bacterium]